MAAAAFCGAGRERRQNLIEKKIKKYKAKAKLLQIAFIIRHRIILSF